MSFISLLFSNRWTQKINFQKNTPACSCVDCVDSCPIPKPQPAPEGPFVIGGFDGYAVIMILVFIIGSLLFIVGIFFCPTKSALGKFLWKHNLTNIMFLFTRAQCDLMLCE